METDESGRLEDALSFAVARARREVHDAHLAEDLAQEAMLRLLQQENPPANIEAWLTRVVANLAKDDHRRRNRVDPHPGAVEYGGLPGDRDLAALGMVNWVSGPALNALKLRGVMDSLGARESQVLTLHLQGWTNSEIAHHLGFASEASVRTIISRTKARIRADVDLHTGEG